MTVKRIVRMGDPQLSQVSRPVTEFNTPELQQLIEDMFDTMQAMNGVGIAAPQIGVNLRVVMFGVDHNPRYPQAEPVPLTVLINPTIKILTKETKQMWEGCMSVPGLRGLVPRYTHLHYRGYDQQGKPFEREVKDFHARVIQHECDHLDGILFPHRIKDFRHFGFEPELEATIKDFYAKEI